MSVTIPSDAALGTTVPVGGTKSPEKQLAASTMGSSARGSGKDNSVRSDPSLSLGSERRVSLESKIVDQDLEGSLAASSTAAAAKGSYLTRRFGELTNWVDDYKTKNSGYGPPYYTEYGGDLPAECNRMGADSTEIHELLRNGANPNVGHPEDHGLTPIHFAARFGNLELLKMLKRAGGNPDITSALGLTPLSYCCTFKLSMDPKGGGPLENMQAAAVNWLLEQGADPNHVDKAGYTPLAWACRSGVLPAVIALVDAGADVMLRRPKLPGGSQVCLPKVDPLAVTCSKRVERYVQAKINTILQREESLLRRDVQDDSSKVRLKAIVDAIAKRKAARQLVIWNKQLAQQTQELSLELMKIDKAEETRKARRDWLRLMKLSPGVWTKVEPVSEGTDDISGRGRSPVSPGSRGRAPRPRWVFDTSMALSTKDAAAHDVLEEARQVEAFILNGDQKQKILAPRWRAMTGKRLLRLEHGQRLGEGHKGRRQRRRSRGAGDGVASVAPLSGLEEEQSSSSSSSGSSSGNEDEGAGGR